jgi:hypothetical protein
MQEVARRIGHTSKIEVCEQRAKQADSIRAPGQRDIYQGIVDQGINSTVLEQTPCVLRS